MSDDKIVRYATNRLRFGYCDELGPLLRETRLVYIYLTRANKEARIPKRLAHCEPCRDCAKAPKTPNPRKDRP